jgi:hypothetical protein
LIYGEKLTKPTKKSKYRGWYFVKRIMKAT